MLPRPQHAVEYGLLIAGIAALIAIMVFAFGGVLSHIFKNMCNKVGSGASAGTC
ncbi:Flp family type IVb pilin [Nocardioides cynanchi]|uniref:Flp family type IVb pilin n=1 Tax=Nocardioides cynanchi TaxID=2558918 RepID=UPI001246D6DD|nr:Flp family type IVb pilin [Nocardioides cynanchi]